MSSEHPIYGYGSWFEGRQKTPREVEEEALREKDRQIAEEVRRNERKARIREVCEPHYRSLLVANGTFRGKIALSVVLPDDSNGLLLRHLSKERVLDESGLFAYIVSPTGFYRFGPITPYSLQLTEEATPELRLSRVLIFLAHRKHPRIENIFDLPKREGKETLSHYVQARDRSVMAAGVSETYHNLKIAELIGPVCPN